MGIIKYSYDPDRRPTTPSSLDDEFDDGSLAAKWTLFNPAGITLTTTEAAGLLQLQAATDPGDNVTGYFQTLPSGDFTIVTKVSLTAQRIDNNVCGIMLLEDATGNPSTTDILTMQLRISVTDAPCAVRAARWSQYDTFLTSYILHSGLNLTDAYLRMRRLSTTLFYEFSSDGIGFCSIVNNTQPFAPAECGIFVNNGNTGATLNAFFDFFRYKNSNDVSLIGNW